MKLTMVEGEPTLSSGAQAPVDMGISTDREDQLMILNVLSNTLYTDKLGAVLREYGCNAADANTEAGKGDMPIEVWLPTRLESTLSIRDFGYGMTKEQVLKTFCQLGRSTKRASNAYTGMLGIGSKAGFAYGDSFLVTCYVAGLKTVYNCFRDQGAPRLAELATTPTDAPDGVEVKIPIRSADVDECVQKAERIFRYFKVCPKLHGARVDFTRAKPTFSGTNWRYTGEGWSVAIMGNVGYQISAAQLTSPLFQLGVEMDFEIGELEIAANRESVQYKDATKAALEKRAKEVVVEVTKALQTQITGASSLWEAHRRYGEAFEKGGNGRNLKSLVLNGGLFWRGSAVNTGRFRLANWNTKIDGVSVVEISRYGRRARFQRIPHPETVYANAKTTLVINDLSSKGSPSREKGFFNQFPDRERMVLFTFADATVQADYWATRGLVGAPTILLSSITPKVAVNGSSVNQYKDKHGGRAFTLIESRTIGGACSLWWEKVPVDYKKDGGAYVEISEFKIQGRGKGEDPGTFQGEVTRLRKEGLITGPVYGFKSDRIPKLGPRWLRLEDHVAAQLRLKTRGTFAQEMADYLHAGLYENLFDPKLEREFPNNSSIRKLLKEVNRMRGPIEKPLFELALRGVCQTWFDLPDNLPKPTVDLGVLDAAILKQYPLLSTIMQGRDDRLESMIGPEVKNLIPYLEALQP